LFAKTPFAFAKAYEWAEREPEYERRAGFVMMVAIAVHQKQCPDEELLGFFPVIEKWSEDPRNFVKKAVNWALRQLGKRSLYLHPIAMATAEKLAEKPNKTARWIGKDALRELASEKILDRLNRKADAAHLR
ncbi:MAG: DNA alkylation repair protein, partial [Bacteroidota bacterium]